MMAIKLKTPLSYRLLFTLGRMFGYNVVIMHDAGITKYSKRIEIHK